MKKKILSVTLAAVLAAALLTACGSDNGRETVMPAKQEAPAEETAPEKETPAEEAAAVEENEPTEEADSEMVSDETFAQLQENYELMSECYDQVLDLYSSDDIKANADIEEAMLMAAEVIDEMGEITQDSITEEDAETLNQAILDILNGLSYLVDGMEIENGSNDEAVSDETFAQLQENYEAMTEAYNAVAEAYNSDEVAANPEIEEAMAEAAAVIEEMGTIEQQNITEADAEDLNGAMLNILEALQIIVNTMG